MTTPCVDRHESGDVETGVFHVTSRGNAGQPIFRDEVDYSTFLRMLAPVAADFGWLCSAFCLMPNRYHLLLEFRRAASRAACIY